MESVVRIKPELMSTVSKMLAPGEIVLIAVPYGRGAGLPGKIQKATDWDYLILTDKRIVDIKGTFFKDRSGFTAWPRRMCVSAEIKAFLMGCNVRISINCGDEGSTEKVIEFANLRKPEAESIVRELSVVSKRKTCPKCTGILEKDCTFCPNCGAPLKKICPQCGKTLDKDSSTCPHCRCG